MGNPEHPAAAESSPRVNPKDEGSGVSTNTDAEPIKASFGFGQTSPQLLWVQEKEIGDLPPPDVEEDSFAQQAGQVVTSCCLVFYFFLIRSTKLTSYFNSR